MARDSALPTLAAWTALITAIALVALKITAWVLTGSIALLSSAIDGLVDTVSTVVTFIGVRYAQRPPDSDHRFGHGSRSSNRHGDTPPAIGDGFLLGSLPRIFRSR
jgi:divalent metal cation (Fe/Co/Zn/Cd) transporter